MAKKRISRSRKRELIDPDEFISFWTQLYEYISKNRLKASCVIGGVVVFFIVAASFFYFLKKAENTAFALLQQDIIKYQTLQKTVGPEKAYSDVDKDFQLIMEKYSRTAGGKLAKIFYANICYTAQDYNKAIELYKKSLEDFNEDPFIKNLILNSLGYAYNAKEDYKTAVKYFAMVASAPDNNIKDEALFNLGELYDTMGDHHKSKDAFKKILSDHAESIYTEIVKEKVKS